MIRTLMKSKIHRVAATQTDVNYNGSITIDRELAVQDAFDLFDFPFQMPPVGDILHARLPS